MTLFQVVRPLFRIWVPVWQGKQLIIFMQKWFFWIKCLQHSVSKFAACHSIGVTGYFFPFVQWLEGHTKRVQAFKLKLTSFINCWSLLCVPFLWLSFFMWLNKNPFISCLSSFISTPVVNWKRKEQNIEKILFCREKRDVKERRTLKHKGNLFENLRYIAVV